ncbi:MAG: hypothetical protein ACOZBL_00040 [Patescibacteria group bacterium]
MNIAIIQLSSQIKMFFQSGEMHTQFINILSFSHIFSASQVFVSNIFIQCEVVIANVFESELIALAVILHSIGFL